MATGDYCTLNELKKDLWPEQSVPDVTDDAKLKSVITAVSREINNYTGTRFYTTSSDETMYFTAKDACYCWIWPATSITSVATDHNLDRTYSVSWTVNTHFEYWPKNYSVKSLPICRIDRVPLGDYQFPTSANAVKVVGKFGYDSATAVANTMAPIKQVCLLKCVRMFKRKDAPFGVLGPTEVGQVSVIPGFDPDELRILDQYRFTYVDNLG